MRELGAYEWLWARQNQTFKKIADLFRENENALPSDLADPQESDDIGRQVVALLRSRVGNFGVRLNRTCDYPPKLRDALNPVEMLYFQGVWELVNTPSIAIVGTRKPTPEGRDEAAALAKLLVGHGWTIVSGLAAGIDTAAHEGAIAASGLTIGVIGTPLSESYPRENSALQRQIGEKYLLISQVPVYRYGQQIWMQNRFFFPERNVTMSALTAATVIVEASDTSGTLIQARAALQQGRHLFILERCFRDRKLRWPRRFEQMNDKRVHRVEDLADIPAILAADASTDR